MAPPQEIPTVYTLEDIESVVSDPQFAVELIDAIQEGFVAYSKGNFNAAPIQTLGAPPMAPFVNVDNYSAQTCVKSGYITGGDHYVIKIASGGNPHPNSGLMQLYSQKTGKFEMLLLDDGLLTELRTAAVGAVAARMLAPDLSDEAACIGVLGTGVQARYQLQYLAHVTGCRNVRVWGRTEKNTVQFIKDMEAEGWNVTPVESSQHLLQPPTNEWYCPLIVTTTSSRVPLLKLDGSKLSKRPLHITCIGSDSTGKLELDPKLVAAADLLVADSRIQTQERGEFEDAIKQGLVSLESITELGELVLEKKSWRSNDDNDARFTVFDSSGVAVQDCIIASMFALRASK
jgi:ornithine cyclodeaminase/alanine dehydrogenase-like protein (mu-crystallin family)